MDHVDSKKVNLEALSKEELVKKCKSLIALAQKIKNAKEDLQGENGQLKEKLSRVQQADVAVELVEKLTEEKLQLFTQVEDLRKHNKLIQNSNQLLENECKDAREKIVVLETENTSYSRQIKRLTDENEQLITDLSTLESQVAELHKLGIQQKAQLLDFEKSNGDSLKDLQTKLTNSQAEIQKLSTNLSCKEKEVSELSQELQALKIVRSSSLIQSNTDCDKYIKEIKSLKLENENNSKELVDIKNVNAQLKDKLTLYHTKLKKFALVTKEVKEEKNEILQLFKSYTQQIHVWKDQLTFASKQFMQLVNHAERENVNLKNESEKHLHEHEIKLKNLESECNSKVTAYIEEIAKLQDELLDYKTLLNTLNGKIEETEKENKKLKEEITIKDIAFNESNQKYEAENLKLNDSLTLRKEEIKINEALKQTNDIEKKLSELSSEEISRLAEVNKELEEKCIALQEQLNIITNESYKDTCVQTDQEGAFLSTLEERDLKRENAEMLLEMNQMNQELKERGETISQLEAHCEEIKKKLQLYETQANKNIDSITEKEETIKILSQEVDKLKNNNSEDVLSKDKEEIASLKAELDALKEKLNGNFDSSYADSEAMSTSTISRSEEANRLKDLEGSWEERYVKLRTLAVKLKAKIREQNTKIAELEKENLEVMKKQSNALKTVQTLQNQIDDLQDALESSKKENKQYLTKLDSVAESISKDKQLLVANEETIAKLNVEVERLNQEKQSVENWKKQVSAKVQTLRKDLEAKNLVIKESENQIAKLRSELDNKTTQLKAEEENHKQTKNILDQTSTECKKNSLLSLEMQDYEKSVKELSQKIEKQKIEINNLQAQLDTQKTTVNALREQNNILEERIEEEKSGQNANSLELASCKTNIAKLEGLLQEKEQKLSDTTNILEKARFENEELSTELSKVIAEHQKSVSTLKAERDQLRTQIMGLQQNLRDTQNILQLREDELHAIKEDYETYKVRAQSVLKKNQNRDLGLEEKLTEELDTVKSQNSELSEEIRSTKKQYEDLQTNNELLIHEKEALFKKTKELESEVEELKNYSEQLEAKHQRIVEEHAETVRNLKVHADTLSQCYRQQIAELEVRHNREIIELQSRLEKAPSPIETLPAVPNMPREEGEGSESVESNVPPSVHPIPLERLLDSKSDDEVNHVKKQLLDQESKVVHLTDLLSDTEQDLAKHVQMNKVLKEEIRRQQRSVEREKHAENLEYLKNVVFKFITLNNSDERSRLVPVLNTILKLSPEESKKLSMVAKGDPGIKGWTSYLPMWPNKPQ